MQSRSFLTGFALSLFGFASAGALAFALSAGRINPNAVEGIGWTATMVRERTALLDARQEPVIAVVAGSGGMFGIDAAMIEKATGIKTINASTHAGLGWEVLDREILPHLRYGDVVLLPLELEYLQSSPIAPLSNLSVGVAHSLGLDFFWSLSWRTKAEYLRLLPLRFLRQQLTLSHREEHSRPLSGYWAFATLPNGDLDQSGSVLNDEEVVASARAQHISGEISSPEGVCHSIKELLGRGVEVITTPPNIYVLPEKVSDYRAQLPRMEAFYRGCGASFVSDPAGGMVPKEWGFDTVYHLNSWGKRSRTAALMPSLCSKLSCL